MSRDNRKLKNFVIRQEEQIKIAALVACLFFVVLIFFIVLNLTFAMNQLRNFEAAFNIDPAMVDDAIASLIRSTIYICGMIAAAAIAVFAYAIHLSHRFFGPLVPIERLLEELKNGKYGGQAKLREKDQLHSVMTKVNELSTILAQNKVGSRGE